MLRVVDLWQLMQARVAEKACYPVVVSHGTLFWSLCCFDAGPGTPSHVFPKGFSTIALATVAIGLLQEDIDLG